jgi:hypothetical protein
MKQVASAHSLDTVVFVLPTIYMGENSDLSKWLFHQVEDVVFEEELAPFNGGYWDCFLNASVVDRLD